MKDVAFRKIIETLREDSNLNRATSSALAELAQNASRLHFDKGEHIFTIGDDADQYYFVESGRVVMSRESATGKVFTYRIAVRGTPLNAVTCFRTRAHLFSARVVEKASVIVIPCLVFKPWVLNNPDVAAGILSTIGDLLDGAYTRILDMIDESVENRILNALSMLSSRIGPDLPLTNNDVAELVGTSRETAARVISRLQDGGLISKSRGAIRITDKPRLDDLSTSPFFIV
ncbi:Crp/Fnr family transcriptional regulator [Desulfovibrio ferrophilus]|uniref:Transcriptional regulator, Crp/Fnr family n=1 Tax=Desulfovibrio ferrophilus TaxID=241368 RepID=A0A2Z6B293_9BACT|nr:Crp/Fnr family transcriptional regulator [Desulfovibrio ferrophilus]BBD09526.1 transcriptional regulator, Crp/Fnr family [Desulfovibrio ferrophilus]